MDQQIRDLMNDLGVATNQKQHTSPVDLNDACSKPRL